MCPGFDSRTRCYMWVEFVVFLSLLRKIFSPGTPGFPSAQKPTFLNSNSIRNPRATRLSVARLLDVTFVNKDDLFIYFYFNIETRETVTISKA